MRSLYAPVLALTLAAAPLAASPAAAQSSTVRASASDSVSRIVPRQSLRSADFSIVSRDGTKAILQRGDAIVVQLTDRGLARFEGSAAAPKPEQGALARLVEGMVRGGLRVMLDNAIEYDVTALREVRHERGRLVFIDRDGRQVFDRLEIDGEEFMESFAPRDAEAFARHVNRLLARRAGR
jgi:hypothetical protein